MRQRATWGYIVLVLLALAAPAAAQTINPTKVEFTVSADHNVLVLGQAAVTRYDLRVYAEGAAQPMTTSDLGKPAAVDNATVTIDRAAVFAAVPLGAYTGRVAAMGPGGEGVSDAVPFGRLLAPSAPRSVGLAR